MPAGPTGRRVVIVTTCDVRPGPAGSVYVSVMASVPDGTGDHVLAPVPVPVAPVGAVGLSVKVALVDRVNVRVSGQVWVVCLVQDVVVVHEVSEVLLVFAVSVVFVEGRGGRVRVNEAVIRGPVNVGRKDSSVVFSLGFTVGTVSVKLAVTSDKGSSLAVSVAGNVCRD